jgi:hypothetical protein
MRERPQRIRSNERSEHNAIFHKDERIADSNGFVGVTFVANINIDNNLRGRAIFVLVVEVQQLLFWNLRSSLMLDLLNGSRTTFDNDSNRDVFNVQTILLNTKNTSQTVAPSVKPPAVSGCSTFTPSLGIFGRIVLHSSSTSYT